MQDHQKKLGKKHVNESRVTSHKLRITDESVSTQIDLQNNSRVVSSAPEVESGTEQVAPRLSCLTVLSCLQAIRVKDGERLHQMLSSSPALWEALESISHQYVLEAM